jgi:hypothetical protein
LIGGKDFHLPFDKVNNLKEGSWRHTEEREEYFVFCGRRGEKESMEKRLILMWEKLLFIKKKMCKQEHGRKLCVAST